MIQKIAKQFQRLHFGHFVLVKLNVIILGSNLLMTIGLTYGFKPKIHHMIIFSIIGVALLWFIGYVADVTNFKNEFIKHNNEATITEIKNHFSKKKA